MIAIKSLRKRQRRWRGRKMLRGGEFLGI